MSAPAENPETVKELIGLLEDSLLQAKEAYSQLEAAREEKVRLEKVAAEAKAAKAVDPALVDRTVNLLLEHNFLDVSQREKFASSLVSHPCNALKLVNRIVEISVPAYSEGRGVPKKASETVSLSHEDDLYWENVIQNGA